MEYIDHWTKEKIYKVLYKSNFDDVMSELIDEMILRDIEKELLKLNFERVINDLKYEIFSRRARKSIYKGVKNYNLIFRNLRRYECDDD